MLVFRTDAPQLGKQTRHSLSSSFSSLSLHIFFPSSKKVTKFAEGTVVSIGFPVMGLTFFDFRQLSIHERS